GTLGCVSPIATSIAMAVAMLALVRVGRRLLPLVAGILYFIGAWRAGSVLAAHDRARDVPIRAGPWPARVDIAGEIVPSPVLLGDALRVDVDDPHYGRITLVVPFGESSCLARGD